MKLTKFLLPYPVLGRDGAFADSCVAKAQMSFTTSLQNYNFNIEYQITDAQILQLIKDNKAKFACEIDCAKTYYRKTFLYDKNKFEIEIPRTSLVGPVLFFFSVVAVEQINDYQNSNFNQHYYAGYRFNLQKGDLLAFLGEHEFNASIKYNELKAIGSIVEVKEDPSQNFTHFDFSTDKIRIFLPTSEFKNFNLSNSQSWADITHASIVQCALISALYAFKHHKNTLWAESLRMRVKTEKALKEYEHLEDLDGQQIAKLVNLLLDNPNKRMFATIDSLRKNI